MKYSVGQKVKIHSLEWYRDNVNRYGIIECGKYEFFEPMNEYCGKVVTIKRIDDDNYRIDVDKGAFCWTDEMIDGLVEEEVDLIPKFGEYSDNEPLDVPTTTTEFVKEYGLPCPNGYIFKDENGNVINAQKIVLEKKKKEYPKTYEECAKIMNCPIDGPSGWLFNFDANIKDPYYRKIDILMGKFTRLLICRDAYWKIAGDEMGLGKPWKPNDSSGYCTYAILRHTGHIRKSRPYADSELLEFPTEEMRDAFYENFKELIESVKELL